MRPNRYVVVVVVFFLAVVCRLPAQLDPANPPTDDLDYGEFQQKVAAMLPDQPDLLKFSPLCNFSFAPWPAGLGNAASGFEEAFNGYSLKTDKERVLLLDRANRSVFAFDSIKGTSTLVATDYQARGLQFDDFALLREGKLVLADNARNSLLFFADNQLKKQVGFDGDRILFRHIDFVEADRLGLNVLVYDSGRDHTYVFAGDGTLKWEINGGVEPSFLGNSLIRLEKQNSRLKILRLSEISRQPVEIAAYECVSGNIILDAWVVGTFAGSLAVVVYEGHGDEDHPDYARLLMVKDGSVAVHRFMPGLDFRLPLLKPYHLLIDRSGPKLITARITPEGLSVVATAIPLK